MADEKETKKKKKLPTALKRKKQDLKKYARNKSFRSRIHTARVAYKKMETEEEKEKGLSLIYSLVDKAVKKKIYSRNKAARIKSRSVV